MRQMHIMVLTLILDWLYYFFLCYFLILLFICFVWFHAIAWVDLQPSLTLNLKQSSCFSILKTEITGRNYAQLSSIFFNYQYVQ